MGFVSRCSHCGAARPGRDPGSAALAKQAAAAELAGKLGQLLDMGFGEVAARATLESAGGHLQTAVDRLLLAGGTNL